MGATDWVHAEVRGRAGCITLQRPQALNALDLGMVRELTTQLLRWRDDDAVDAVLVRGSNKAGPFGAFCAGGDIRFFHQAALAGDARLEDFFTEEYSLNYLIHTYPKPYVAFMDGIVMGGGMGISQGASHRVVTPATKMAMPETNIGLFPDVGGGYFLSRCPGHAGEWLALTGAVLHGAEPLAVGLADVLVNAADLPGLWDALCAAPSLQRAQIDPVIASCAHATTAEMTEALANADRHFGQQDVTSILASLQRDGSPWATETLAMLRKRSPLMLHVVLEQMRRARGMSLADDLRMERDLVRHCFHPHHLGRTAAQSETVEGIRALAVDKDQMPRWNPANADAVTADLVAPFFESPWPTQAHPLASLGVASAIQEICSQP